MPPPRRRLLASSLAAAVLALAVAPTARAAPHIVNADAAVVVPWQALVLAQLPGGRLAQCGGTIRDAHHVITAAHCTFDEEAGTLEPAPIPPQAFLVVAGIADLGALAAGQRRGVTAVSSDPQLAYTSQLAPVGDDAVLTLGAPLDLSSPAVADALPVLPEGATASRVAISGWGLTDPDNQQSTPNLLQQAVVDVFADAACARYRDSYVPAVMFCSGRANPNGTQTATCQGDSGGPVARVTGESPSGPVVDGLYGIVSFGGTRCADPAFPDVHTRVTDPAIHAFLTQQAYTQRPINIGPPSIVAAKQFAVGGELRCQPGAWTGSPELTFEFDRVPMVGGAAAYDRRVAVASGPSATYGIEEADDGALFTCIVRARNSGGVVAVAAAARGPVGAIVDAAPSRDVTPPTSRFGRTRCAGGVCTAVLRVRDAGGAGRTRVYSPHFTRVGRCTTRCRGRVAARTVAPGVFVLRTPRLPRGRYRLVARAADAAGNVQVRATTVVVRVRR